MSTTRSLVISTALASNQQEGTLQRSHVSTLIVFDMISLTRQWQFSTDAKKRDNYFRLNDLAVNHMRDNGGPTQSIIQTVLEYDNVTDEHISLCEEIASNPIVLSLPVPNTEHVRPFAAVAGP